MSVVEEAIQSEISESNKLEDIWKEGIDSSGNEVEYEDNENKPPENETQKSARAKPEIQYSRDELYEIKKLPASQLKPDFLEHHPLEINSAVRSLKDDFVKGNYEGPNSLEQPRERWTRSVTPNDAHDSFNDNKMRRDNRMRKDPESGLVLSPQRRSFNLGCLMTGGIMNNRDPGKERDMSNRRSFGSGRINNSFGDNPESHTTFVAPNLMPDYTKRGQSNSQQGNSMGFERRYNNDKRMNNRSNGYNNVDYNNGGQDYRNNGGQDYRNNDYRNNGDYRSYHNMNGDRRRHNSDRNNDFMDEPEWFSGGPTSQNDVIELHGFDKDEDTSPEKSSNNKKNNNANNNKLSNNNNQRAHVKSSAEEVKEQKNESELQENSTISCNNEENKENRMQDLMKFATEPNIDDLLTNLDTFPSLFNAPETVESNNSSGGGGGGAGGSRFSRWFQRESPTSGSTPSPNMFNPNNMLNDLINADDKRSSDQFAPISPVFNGPGMGGSKRSNSSNFIDMLKQDFNSGPGSNLIRSGSIRDLEGVGKLHSVEEVEAKIRHHTPNPMSNAAHTKEEDMANFKKLMMSKLMQQQQAAQLQQNLGVGGIGGGASQMPAGPAWNNIVHQNNPNYHQIIQRIVKVQQEQEYQRRMSQLGGFIPPHHGSSPLPPELQQHLLANPQFDARNLIRPSLGGTLSPNQIPSANASASFIQSAAALSQQQTQQLAQQAAQAQHLAATQQQYLIHPQNATSNSLSNSVFQQRAPSPSQIAAQSETLLQNAILKKKLEEQKDNLRKRQEMLQRAASPNIVNGLTGSHPLTLPGHELRNSASSPVINAFTPTSVLRKMTASGTSPETHDSSKIIRQGKDVLLNHSHSGSHPTGPINAWQHRAQQQSLVNKNNIPALLNLGNQHPRSKFTMSSKMNTKPPAHLAQSLADQMSAMKSDSNLHHNVQNNFFTSNLASHHSQANDPGPTNVQLEKWFSPELLARARAGGLPNIQQVPPTQNLLSVEELERLQQPPTSSVPI